MFNKYKIECERSEIKLPNFQVNIKSKLKICLIPSFQLRNNNSFFK